jgi:hypothetical protein
MAISDHDLEVIQGALAIATYRSLERNNGEAVEILRAVSLRVDVEVRRREVGPYSLAEARDRGGWYRRIGDAWWRREIDGVMHSRSDAAGARAVAMDRSGVLDVADAAAADWEVSP